MIVQKFGGTSVAGPEPIRRVAEIVRRSLPSQPVVVLSAVAGVTNRLFRLADLALEGSDWGPELEELRELHAGILSGLGIEEPSVGELLGELGRLLSGISMLRECSPRAKDQLASYGERLSARIVAAYLRKAGVPAKAFDAFEVGLTTDGRFGEARPLPDVDERIRHALAPFEGVPIITGYIGRDQAGNITTLGRGGSDYSASIFGAALDADEIQIWTDVDGVMTVDPRIVKSARFIQKLSFAEASELAFYGARVLHPSTMIPAVRKGIPVRVLNSYKPEFGGTTIVARLAPEERGVKSIASKDRVTVVNIVSPPMIFQYGFLERIADAFARHEIVIDMIATSEVSVAMTTGPVAKLEPVVAELSQFSEVTVQRDMSQISIVGEELRDRYDLAAQVFGALARLKVRVELISFGATRNNLSLVVAQDRIREVVSALHAEIFES